jgi:Tfp pilus assembly protein PilF
MKKGWRILAACSLLILFLASCGPSKTDLRRREIAQRDLGSQYLLAGDSTTALKHLLEAEKLYPKDHILQNYLGLAYMAKNSPDLAIEHYRKALKLKSDYAPAKNNLGAVYLEQENWDAAIAVYQELTGDLLYATPHYPLSNLGYAYYKKKQYKRSEKYYRQALKLEPTHPPALRGLGRTYVAMGRGAEAVAALSLVIERYPEFAGAHYDLARAYMLLREYRKAKEAYRNVVALEPGSPEAAEARRMLQRLRHVK